MDLNVTAGTETEVNRTFLQGMIDRMSMSFFKYGAIRLGYPSKVNALRSLRVRLDQYERTGNTEFLIDVANFAMIEFTLPAHPLAHFTPEDSDKSPGRVWHGEREGSRNSNDSER